MRLEISANNGYARHSQRCIPRRCVAESMLRVPPHAASPEIDHDNDHTLTRSHLKPMPQVSASSATSRNPINASRLDSETQCRATQRTATKRKASNRNTSSRSNVSGALQLACLCVQICVEAAIQRRASACCRGPSAQRNIISIFSDTYKISGGCCRSTRCSSDASTCKTSLLEHQ